MAAARAARAAPVFGGLPALPMEAHQMLDDQTGFRSLLAHAREKTIADEAANKESDNV